MNWFPLPIFPEGSLASSVVTTVWVGVLVFCVMNLRFGWPFSGLVVPGYLVPLLIVKPWAAVIVVVEAILTFLVARALIEGLPRFGIAARLFGRDRFLAMIIVSAGMRLLFDAWLLPAFGAWATAAWDWHFDYRNNLQSFGLIVVCLMANQLWKTGVRRGAMSFLCNLAITYAIVRFVLMEFTNFGISRLGFLYEDVAASIFAAPKAYIILITSAMLASRMNLRYGWDFHGILIPALLALQWYEPTKILTSFVEALVILGGARLVMKAPGIRDLTMEGARKMLLFFTISFAYKMVVGFGLAEFSPETKVSDYYGFGYLVPTLLALKMQELGRIGHQISITVQISLASVVVANAVGLLLLALPIGVGEPRNPGIAVTQPNGTTAEEVFRAGFVASHRSVGATLPPPTGEVAYCFDRGVGELLAWTEERDGEGGDDASLGRAAGFLARAGFAVELVGGRLAVVTDQGPHGGRGQFVVARGAVTPLLVGVPAALEETGAFEAGWAVFEALGARALVVGGAESGDPGSAAGAGTGIREMLYHRLGGQGALEIRSREAGAVLHVAGGVPESLSIARLERIGGPFEVRWSAPDIENPVRERARGGFCELFVDPLIPVERSFPTPAVERVDGSLAAFLVRESRAPAPSGSDLHRPPSPAELLHLDRHLVTPLFRATAEGLDRRLPLLARVAEGAGFRLRVLEHGGDRLLLLQEADSDRRRFLGEIVFRVPQVAADEPAIGFEVPSRASDGSVVGFAADRFERLGARLLLVAGTSSDTNRDGTTRLTFLGNRETFFNLAHQSFLRAMAGRRPAVVQCRAFAPVEEIGLPDGDLVWSVVDRALPRSRVDELLAPVRRLLEEDGLAVIDADETEETAWFAIDTNAQGVYMDLAGDAAFAAAWLTPAVRRIYRPADAQLERAAALEALGIEVASVPLDELVAGAAFRDPREAATAAALEDDLRRFRSTGDILRLRAALGREDGLRFRATLDPMNGQLYLAALGSDDTIVLVANLVRGAPERRMRPGDPEAIARFRRARAAWLHAHAD